MAATKDLGVIYAVAVVDDARITCDPMQYVRFHLQNTAFSALLTVCKLSWLSSCACQEYMFVLLCITCAFTCSTLHFHC
jgi:hypothetical protein